MRLKGEQVLQVPSDEAWLALNDTALLKRSIPGCESIVLVAPDADANADDPPADRRYDLRMKIAAGPVDVVVRGTLALRDLRPPHAYTLHFAGDAGPAGFGEATAAVELLAVDEKTTRLVYDAEITVGGRVAKAGALILGIAARRIARHFFEGFATLVRDRRTTP